MKPTPLALFSSEFIRGLPSQLQMDSMVLPLVTLVRMVSQSWVVESGSTSPMDSALFRNSRAYW